MAASRLRALPDENGVPVTTGIELDVVVADSGRADAHAFRMAAAGDAQAAPDSAVQASLGCGNPVAIAGLYPGQVVVDLGSGGGLDVILAARRVGPTGYVYGIDMTPEMLELARVNQSRSGLSNVSFVQGRIEDVPLRDGLADVVISNCVINLAPDKDAVLGECYRVLRPGGVLAVSDTVWIKPPPQSVTASRDSWAQCVAGALPVETYRSKLASAGFGEIDIQVSGGVTWGPAELASAYIRARKPVAPLAPVFRPAAAADENAVRELLSGCGLPLAGLPRRGHSREAVWPQGVGWHACA